MRIKILILLLILSSGLYAVSLWETDTFFQMQILPGDILRVHFQEKRVLKFEQKLRNVDNQSLQGKTFTGEAWNFLPPATMTQNDAVSGRDELLISQEQDMALSVRVTAVTNREVYLQGRSTSVINGESMEFLLQGQVPIQRIQADHSLYSQDIYNLKFTLNNTVQDQEAFLTMEDLIFETNYSDISTNLQIQNGQTNIQLLTNTSSVSLRFKTLSDPPKKAMVLYYLNAMLKNLFY